MIHDDYERDYLTEVMYLQERILDLEKKAVELLNDVERKTAKIIVIDKDKQLTNGQIRVDVLPF